MTYPKASYGPFFQESNSSIQLCYFCRVNLTKWFEKCFTFLPVSHKAFTNVWIHQTCHSLLQITSPTIFFKPPPCTRITPKNVKKKLWETKFYIALRDTMPTPKIILLYLLIIQSKNCILKTKWPHLLTYMAISHRP